MEEIERSIVKQLLSNSDYVDFINSHDEYIWKDRMINLIADAPVSLYKKRDLFKLLSEHEHDSGPTGSYTDCYYQIDRAIVNLALKEKEIFTIEINSANDGHEEQYSLGPALSLDEVKDKVFYETDCETEAEYIEFANQGSYWITLNKYDLSSGKCVCKYEYELLGFTPVWFTLINCTEDNDLVINNDFSSFPEIALPCPYKPGDILRLDCRPYAPIEYAIILCNPKSQMRDCCSPWVLYINKDGDYDMGALNHNAPVREYNAFAMSCLYNLQKISPNDLPKEREALKVVSEFLAGSEEKGSYLNNKFDATTSIRDMNNVIDEYENCNIKRQSDIGE